MLPGAALQITGRANRRMKNASVLSLATSAAVRCTLSSPELTLRFRISMALICRSVSQSIGKTCR